MSGLGPLGAGLAWGLLFTRALPSLLTLSLLSAGLLPWAVSFAVAAALTAGIAPLGAGAWGGSELDLLRAIATELCIGVIFALLAALPLLSLRWAVAPLDRALGGEARALMGPLYVLLAALLVLSLGGHRAWLSALADSVKLVPLGSLALTREALLREALAIVQAGFSAAVSLGLPLWMSVWLLDLTLALVLHRHAAGESVSRLPLRAGLALLLASFLLAPVVSHVPALVRRQLGASATVLPRLAR